jgi:hypothetical protein
MMKRAGSFFIILSCIILLLMLPDSGVHDVREPDSRN